MSRAGKGHERPLRSGNVYAWDARAHRTKQVGGHRADAPRDLASWVHMLAIDAVDGDEVAEIDAGDIGDIDHGHIHRDDANNGGELAAHQNETAVAQRTVHAVTVACC